ncbi:hypothetical protein BDN70DRAFT_936004 [Pholiota conissans]|uniref:F-box domain-containing protein n=1 Tax=Pholiota conissans TaxID=109636 RepID=A0A9P5YVD5_9AGAR|nr:hypothetical protein BDN70DRAFT_936004 [Pholiota conissans]
MLSFTDSGCRLPLDIIDLIMWELAEDEDILTLNRCTRVCLDFAAICQRYLFENITLSDTVNIWHPPSTLTRQFKGVLDSNPKLARHVRKVNYVNKINDSKRMSTIPVLRHLRYVHTFSLEFDDWPISNRQTWSAIPKTLRSSVCRFIKANDIVDLHLRCIEDVPINIFFHLPHLAFLTLSNTTIMDKGLDLIKLRKPESSIQLEALTVWGTIAGMRKLMKATNRASKPLLDLRNLTEFTTAYVSPGEMSTIGAVIAGSNCLEEIHIRGFEIDWRGHLASKLTSKSLRTLKNIDLHFLITAEDDPYHNVVNELEEMSGRNVLETLELVINVYTNDDCTTDMDTWSRLDVVLSQTDGFPYLQHVEVSLITNSFSCDYTELHAQLNHIADVGFPRLNNMPDMDFSFIVEENEV